MVRRTLLTLACLSLACAAKGAEDEPYSTYDSAFATLVAHDSILLEDPAGDEALADGTLAPDQDDLTDGALPGGCGCGTCSGSSGCGCRFEGLFGRGLIGRTEPCFNDFISPQSNPLFFEDPRTLTEIRFHFANQNIPDSNPLFRGGSAQFFAAQIRAALTERLSLIATKDGYIHLHGDDPAFVDADGWADIAAGLKYNLIRDPQAGTVLSTGLTYEIDAGEHQVFQGRGDGEFHMFVTGGKRLDPCTHWLSGTGFRIPTDHTARSQMWYWSNHVDREVFRDIYAVWEVNWFHWLRSGEALPGIDFEGGDLFNIGAGDVAGNDIVTMAVGSRWKPRNNVETGVAWEFPVTQRRDLLHDRLYLDLILRY